MAELFDSLSGRTRLRTFVEYLVVFCSRPETASDIISGRLVGPIVCDKRLKFLDPRLNHSREIPPEAVKLWLPNSTEIDLRLGFRVDLGDRKWLKSKYRPHIPIRLLYTPQAYLAPFGHNTQRGERTSTFGSMSVS